MKKPCRGFTMVEIIIVVIILAIIAAFGYPNYNRSRQRTDERDGAANLSAIASEMNLYQLRNNGYPPSNLNTVTDINTTLDLGIIEQNMTYSCTSSTANFRCTAVSTFGWTLDVDPQDSGTPQCSAGTCPSCSPACNY